MLFLLLLFWTLGLNTVPSSHTTQIKEKKVDGHSIRGSTEVVMCFIPFPLQFRYYGLLLQSISVPPLSCHSAPLDCKAPNPTISAYHSYPGALEKITQPCELVLCKPIITIPLRSYILIQLWLRVKSKMVWFILGLDFARWVNERMEVVVWMNWRDLEV